MNTVKTWEALLTPTCRRLKVVLANTSLVCFTGLDTIWVTLAACAALTVVTTQINAVEVTDITFPAGTFIHITFTCTLTTNLKQN